mmetsp:Transcript_16291/g.49836  ORF Transcript_16291/g.49836 Transcript_16291/m.49836 type:complete len:432 (-) Transcript_16291:261-1556(-)
MGRSIAPSLRGRSWCPTVSVWCLLFGTSLSGELEPLPGQVNLSKSSAYNHDMNVAVHTPPREVSTEALWARVSNHGSDEVYAVQIIMTRFSLGQGHLVELVRGRLCLFESISLPSMAGQTSQHFVWIVYIDRTMDPDQVGALVKLLQPYENFVLAQCPHERSARIQIKKSPMAQLQAVGMWREPPASARDLLYLSTRIDADDGLSLDAIKYMQHKLVPSQAQHVLGQQSAKEAGKAAERYHSVLCWQESYNWVPDERGGHVFYEDMRKHSRRWCLTAGLTLVAAEVEKFTAHSHHHIRWHRRNDTNVLYIRDKRYQPPIRARSVTSNSMSSMSENGNVTDSGQWSGFGGHESKFLKYTEAYGLRKGAIQKCGVLLTRSAARIAEEQLRRACRNGAGRGFSCKESATKQWMEMLALGSNTTSSRMRQLCESW